MIALLALSILPSFEIWGDVTRPQPAWHLLLAKWAVAWMIRRWGDGASVEPISPQHTVED